MMPLTVLCGFDKSNVAQQFERPKNISVYERSYNEYRLLFVVNWGDSAMVYFTLLFSMIDYYLNILNNLESNFMPVNFLL
jgi:hypothetical protein